MAVELQFHTMDDPVAIQESKVHHPTPSHPSSSQTTAFSSMSPFSELSDLRVASGTLEFAIGIRSEGGLVYYSL